MVNKVAMLTRWRVRPCLSSAIGGMIERYTQLAPEIEIIAYRYGYQGMLQGDSITVTPGISGTRPGCTRSAARDRHSRVKLTMLPNWPSGVW